MKENNPMKINGDGNARGGEDMDGLIDGAADIRTLAVVFSAALLLFSRECLLLKSIKPRFATGVGKKSVGDGLGILFISLCISSTRSSSSRLGNISVGSAHKFARAYVGRAFSIQMSPQRA